MTGKTPQKKSIPKTLFSLLLPINRRPPLLLLVGLLLLQVQTHLVPGLERLLDLLRLLRVDLGRDQGLGSCVQDGLQLRERVVDVGRLRPRVGGSDDQLALFVDALLLRALHRLDQLGLEPVRGVEVEAEVGLGVDFVDVLPSRAAGTCELERDVG